MNSFGQMRAAPVFRRRTASSHTVSGVTRLITLVLPRGTTLVTTPIVSVWEFQKSIALQVLYGLCSCGFLIPGWVWDSETGVVLPSVWVWHETGLSRVTAPRRGESLPLLWKEAADYRLFERVVQEEIGKRRRSQNL